MSNAAKRPVCATCSKPSRLCLCRRLKSPPIENSIHVTILQHSLEKDHPLNSTRIAVIGLKSLSVVSVSDVHYEAEHGRLDLDIDIKTISKGFVVKRSQKKTINGTIEEFELAIPPGTALLFPSDRAVDPHRIGFESEVKHLIVLDATWAKAKRMYHENPWLKLLPHLKLEPEGTSLYSEVRHQPKTGCLSTIESVVCALKTLGDDAEGLDGLLEVFESMVADQRRCKAEKLSGVAASS
ncbi:hypothetical protein QJS10_CPB11g01306 [Acorus calamus]|uniref:tRNA-uridine aminocarboxypropyltransferase n=1 Tax=Acorus calamus TaxID=4465 RepID=A0AAV9DQZ6_ACOCL|nr:hypothetical protein QJS10_CPB11g01306 [Acorus calamus]